MRNESEIARPIRAIRVQSFLYIISCGEFMKIGMTANVRLRISQIQNGNPYKLALVASFPVHGEAVRRVELEVHKALFKYRERSRTEWFRVDAAEAVRIATEIVSKETVPPAFTEWEQGMIDKHGMPRFHPSDTPEFRRMRIAWLSLEQPAVLRDLRPKKKRSTPLGVALCS